MARPYRSVTSTVGRTLILPPRCMAKTGSSVTVDGVDSDMDNPQCFTCTVLGEPSSRRQKGAEMARVRETGVARVAIVPQNAGLLLASAQPRCNTRYRQPAITPINLP